MIYSESDVYCSKINVGDLVYKPKAYDHERQLVEIDTSKTWRCVSIEDYFSHIKDFIIIAKFEDDNGNMWSQSGMNNFYKVSGFEKGYEQLLLF